MKVTVSLAVSTLSIVTSKRALAGVDDASGLVRAAEGNLTDDETRKRLSDFVTGFAAFAGA